jgi:hypothetical protein
LHLTSFEISHIPWFHVGPIVQLVLPKEHDINPMKQRERHITLFMPGWDEEEIHQCLEKVYTTSVDKFGEVEMEKNHDLPPLKSKFFGNIPRYILMSDALQVCPGIFVVLWVNQ